MVLKMNVEYEIKDGYLIIRDNRKYLLKTKTRGLPIKSVLSQLPEDIRVESAVAIGLALFRSRKHEVIFNNVRRAIFEPSKRMVLLSLSKYYMTVASLFGRNITMRVATLVRAVLETLP